MRRILPSLLIVLLAVFVASCHKENDEPDPVNQKTLFVYMPWSTDLTSCFLKNIEDLEKAVEEHGLNNERIIVFFATSPTQAEMYEIVKDKTGCRHVPIKSYTSPDFTTCEGLTAILNDFQDSAPALRYAMIIGAHGMGWLPVQGSKKMSKVPWKYHFEADGELRTRFFGALTSNYQTEISTLRESLLNANLHMEFILFDDCYMSSVEVAYEMRDVADHLIACPTEIMDYGMPYALIGGHLLGVPDYQGVTEGFLEFYTNYYKPYGTIGITDCNQLEELASLMREINMKRGDEPLSHDGIQAMDGYEPTIFFDLKSYAEKACDDPILLQLFLQQLERTVPWRAHTPKFPTKSSGPIDIGTFCGITTSAGSNHRLTATWNETKWYQATH